jgi:CBS domain-containing protein
VNIAAFLSSHPPFDSLPDGELESLAVRIKIEFFGAGTPILRQNGEPASSVYVVRTGAVELLGEGRVVDLLGPGEMFGHPSALSREPPSLDVRATEDTLCYLINIADAERMLANRPGLRFLSESLRRRTVRALDGSDASRTEGWAADVGSLIKRPAVTVPPTRTVAEAAALMSEERISSLLISVKGGFGIITDRDLRSRVLAAGRDPATPVSEVMSYPASFVDPRTVRADVLAKMLESGIHHVPVLDRTGTPLGVVTDTDLLGMERTTPFQLRSAIERSSSRDATIEQARWLQRAVRELVEASVDPVEIGHVVAVTLDALTKRLAEIAIGRLGEPPAPWAWIALGSEARHEQALATDQDHALAFEPVGDDDPDPYFAELAEEVTSGLEAAGVPRCRANVTAVNPSWRGSVEAWVSRFRGWISDTGPEGSMLTAIAFDYRRVAGPLDVEAALDPIVRSAPRFPAFLRHIARNAISMHPPTGFFHNVVVHRRGENAGRLDVKHGGITLITGIARAYSLAIGSPEIRTLPRLRAAADAGAIAQEDEVAMRESLRLLWQVRLEHQAQQVARGLQPDDMVDPSALGPLTRRALKEAFLSIGRMQRGRGAPHPPRAGGGPRPPPGRPLDGSGAALTGAAPGSPRWTSRPRAWTCEAITSSLSE